MSHTIAILFLHGIGRTEPGYTTGIQRALTRRFECRVKGEAPDSGSELVFEETNWSASLQREEDRLWDRLDSGSPLRFAPLRRFMVDFAADAIAYQPAPSDRSAYDDIHGAVAESLARLAERAGPRAPLVVVAHSLGTVIASNYLYDLAKRRGSFLSPEVRKKIGKNPLESGETLSLIVTMGSPIALWSLRYPRFGAPIPFPPRKLSVHHPRLRAKWINVYDPDDVIGYPLRGLNARYRETVTEDRSVSVGSILTGWNPMSHVGYWNSRGVADQIGDEIADIWRASSALALVPALERRGATIRKRVAPTRS